MPWQTFTYSLSKRNHMWTQHSKNPKANIPLHCIYTPYIESAVSAGYCDNFQVTPRGLYSFARSRYYRPEQIIVADQCRFESALEGQGETVVYRIATTDGLKGTMVAVPGSNLIDNFILEVDDIQNKVGKLRRNTC